MKSDKPLKVVGWLGNIGITTLIQQATREVGKVEKGQPRKETISSKTKIKISRPS